MLASSTELLYFVVFAAFSSYPRYLETSVQAFADFQLPVGPNS